MSQGYICGLLFIRSKHTSTQAYSSINAWRTKNVGWLLPLLVFYKKQPLRKRRSNGGTGMFWWNVEFAYRLYVRTVLQGNISQEKTSLNNTRKTNKGWQSGGKNSGTYKKERGQRQKIRTIRQEINSRNLFGYFLPFRQTKYSSPLLSHHRGWQWGEDSRGLSKFTEFWWIPSRKSKADLRLAQLYSLMPDSPSECERSAGMEDKNRQTLILSLQRW